MVRLFVLLAGFFGATGVALDAYAAHGMAKVLSEDKIAVFKIGTQYQLMHAIALLAIALLLTQFTGRLFTWAGALISAGIVLFSGSLYLLTYFNLKVGLVTPIGGFAFIFGWLCLMIAAATTSIKK